MTMKAIEKKDLAATLFEIPAGAKKISSTLGADEM
jgi:hypothetical protein